MLPNLASLRSTLSNNKKFISNHIALLGAYLSLKCFFRFSRGVYRSMLRPQVDVTERYGRDSYAVITGGAAGIGKAFALDLARKGFNLILLDKNEQELQNTKQEIQAISANLLVKTIVVDFSNGKDPEFYRKLVDEFSQIDVSILINNVGIGLGTFGFFHQIPSELMLNGFVIKVFPAVFMTKMLIKQMQLRRKQSLVLNISSASSLSPAAAYFSIYGSAKRFMNSFGESLHLEQMTGKKNVDVLTLTPYYVSTQMIGFRKGVFVITPEEVVTTAWRQVTRTHQTIGHWRHELYHLLRFVLFPGDLKVKVDKAITRTAARNTTLRSVQIMKEKKEKEERKE